MHTFPVTSIALVVLLFTGCAGQPFAYHDDNQIPKGSGLVSGEDGVFRLETADLGRLTDDRPQKQ